MKRTLHPLLEFLIVLGILAGTVTFVLNADFNCRKLKSGPDAAGDPSAVTKPVDERYAQGKALFKSNCAACHNLRAPGTGPALAGVTKRWEAAGAFKGKAGKEWLYAWIRNWNEPVDAGYPYAVEMSNTNALQMNIFSNLGDTEIEAILHYLDTEVNSESAKK